MEQWRRLIFRRGTARVSARTTVRGKLSRLHVPVDCQRHQCDRNEPQNDVFTAVLFFRHAEQYTTLEIPVQVLR
jgi:hypothetical protein